MERYRRELRLAGYRMLGSVEDSEDMVQETALRTWRKRGDFEGRSTFRAWLMHGGAGALVETLPNGRRHTLAGQSHDISPDATAPVLEEFLSS